MSEETIVTCPLHSGIQADVEQLKTDNEKQWTAIERLQNRLPVWATMVISVLTFLLGASLTYASLVVRASG
jgi:hypothetical protein